MLKALIFDVDGTLADTESAHRAAFNQAFLEVGRDWVWDEPTYKQLLGISGGKERIFHYWQQVQPDIKQISSSAKQDVVNCMHELKTAIYGRAVHNGEVKLRPGVLRLIEEAHVKGMRLAIATTTSPTNISALLREAIGLDWLHYFQVIEDASTAPLKKPHPQVYLQTLRRMKLDPAHCLAFEDSANGLRAAMASGLATVITTNAFTEDHDFAGALRVLPNLERITLADLHEWHADLAEHALVANDHRGSYP